MDKPRSRAQKSKNPQRAPFRAEIIRKAAALFEQRGYRGVSVDSIADDVGISKPTFYSYIDSKDEIVWEIYDIIRTESVKFARTIATSDLGAKEKLHKIIQGHLESLVGKREFYAVYFQEEAELPKKLQTKHKAAQREYQKVVEDVFRQGIEEGVFPVVDPKIAALGLLGMCNWVCRWYKQGGPLGPGDIAANFFAMLFAPSSTSK